MCFIDVLKNIIKFPAKKTPKIKTVMETQLACAQCCTVHSVECLQDDSKSCDRNIF